MVKNDFFSFTIAEENIINKCNVVCSTLFENSSIPTLLFDQISLTIIFSNKTAKKWFGMNFVSDFSLINIFTDYCSTNQQIEFKKWLNNNDSLIKSLEIDLYNSQGMQSGTLIINPFCFNKMEHYLLCQIIDNTKFKEAIKQLTDKCYRDPLTNLYNRTYLLAELERYEGSRYYPISFFSIDADNLKKVNDIYGHQAGDLYLRNIAKILRISFRKEDILARIGGDEFLVVLLNCSNEQVHRSKQRLISNKQKFNKSNPQNIIDFSIGTSTANYGDNLKSVIHESDIKMLMEKRDKKRGNFSIISG